MPTRADTTRIVVPNKGAMLGGYSTFIDFSSVTPALATIHDATAAAVTTSGGAALCTATGGANGTRFGVSYAKPSGSWDLSDKWIAFDVEWLNSGSGNAGYGQQGIYPALYLCSDTSGFANYAAYLNMGSGYNKIPGRHTLVANPANIVQQAGTFNPAAVKRVEIHFFFQTGAVQALHQVKVYSVSQYAKSRAKVMISFDDEYSSQLLLPLPQWQPIIFQELYI